MIWIHFLLMTVTDWTKIPLVEPGAVENLLGVSDQIHHARQLLLCSASGPEEKWSYGRLLPTRIDNMDNNNIINDKIKNISSTNRCRKPSPFLIYKIYLTQRERKETSEIFNLFKIVNCISLLWSIFYKDSLLSIQ